VNAGSLLFIDAFSSPYPWTEPPSVVQAQTQQHSQSREMEPQRVGGDGALQALFLKVTQWMNARKQQHSNSSSSEPICFSCMVILDDADLLFHQHGDQEEDVMNFIGYFRQLTTTANSDNNSELRLVIKLLSTSDVTSGSDTVVPVNDTEEFSLASSSNSMALASTLAKYVVQCSDLILSVSPLDTGYSRDIHGKVCVMGSFYSCCLFFVLILFLAQLSINLQHEASVEQEKFTTQFHFRISENNVTIIK
jgi:hypothetical protein